MQQIRLFDGGLNTDDAQEAMPAGDYQYLLNGIKARSFSGFGGTIENQQGTTAIGSSVSEVDANSVCVGAVRDQQNSRWFLFMYNSADAQKHCIITLTLTGSTPSIAKILANKCSAWVSGGPYAVGAQVSSGGTNWICITANTSAVAPAVGSSFWVAQSWAGLQFTLGNLITGAACINGVLYWTDNVLPYRCASVTKYAGGLVPVSEEDIQMIKRGGILAPISVKGSAGGQANNTGRYGFQFAYQYVYEDNQYSVLSPYSTLCPANTPAQTFNSITVTSPDAVPLGVVTIKFAARVGNNGSFFYIGDIQRPAGGWYAPYTNQITFYNTNNGSIVSSNYSFPVHAIPLFGKCLDTIRNRIFIANYTEGYNNPIGAGIKTAINNNNYPIGLTTTQTVNVWTLNKITMTNTGTGWFQLSSVPVTDTSPAATLFAINVGTTPDGFGDLTSIPTGTRVTGGGPWTGPVNSSILNTSFWQFSSDGGLSNRANYTKTIGWIDYFYYKWVSFGPLQTYSTTLINGSIFEGTKTFASGSSYGIGYVLKDAQGRSSGVIDPQTVTTPNDAYYNQIGMTWTLPTLYVAADTYAIGSRVMYGAHLWQAVTSNTGVTPVAGANWTDLGSILNFLPSWATSYSIVMTRNLTKSYFLESRSADFNYVKSVSGTQTLSQTYDPTNDALYLDVTPIVKSGLGYQWQAGDRIVLYPTATSTNNGVVGLAPSWDVATLYYVDGLVSYNGVRYKCIAQNTGNAPPNATFWVAQPSISVDLPINGFDGTHLYLPNVCIGSPLGAAPNKTQFEIYRPSLINEATLYYEMGQTYMISTDTVGNRLFTTVSANLYGDSVQTVKTVFILSSGNYITDSYQQFSLYKATSLSPLGDWDTDIGKPYVVTTIGQVYKPNFFRFSSTTINGTSINGLCEFSAFDEGTTAQEDGAIYKLKSASREKDLATVLLAVCKTGASSIYVDSAQMNLDQNTSFLVQSANVIGGNKSLQGGFGTINPESVIDLNDDVYWYDAINGRYIRYATNGLFAISDVKMMKYFEDMRIALKTTPTRVISGYDPFYRLLNVTCSSSATNRKTVSWSPAMKRWISFHSIVPDWMFDIEGLAFSIKAGTVYRHDNSGAFNTFYGVVSDTVLEVCFNDDPDKPKYWSNVAFLGSNNLWSWSSGEQVVANNILKFDLENNFGQGTDVSDARWDIDENMAYGVILKDRNTAVANPYINGDDMYSHIALGRITMFGQASDSIKRIFYLKIGYELSKGHLL